MLNYKTAPKIFVGSTVSDLEKFRVVARDSILLCGGYPQMMEQWPYENQEDPVDVCRRKIRDSAHYIGIFAHRRGWIPDNLPPEYAHKSITELEYHWAHEELGSRNTNVFLPEPSSPLDIELARLAEDDTDLREKQQAFLREVKKHTCHFFKNEIELGIRVTHAVSMWVKTHRDGGLLGYARNHHQPTAERTYTAPPAPPRTAPMPVPKPASPLRDPLEVGRMDHVLDFHHALKVQELKHQVGGCFLIHGPANHGHAEMIELLCRNIPGMIGGQVVQRRWRATISRVLGASAADLLAQLSDEIGQSTDTLIGLAGILREDLQHGPVIIHIDNMNGFHAGLPGFVETFWKPLLIALDQQPGLVPHRLVFMLTLQCDSLPPDWESLIARDTRRDPYAVVGVPPLAMFSPNDLAEWLDGLTLPAGHTAVELAQKIYDLTAGVPSQVYPELRNLLRSIHS